MVLDRLKLSKRVHLPSPKDILGPKKKRRRPTIDASAQPGEIQEALAVVRSLAQKSWDTRCAGCRRDITADLDIVLCIDTWRGGPGEANTTPVNARNAPCSSHCRTCSVITCLGCGRPVNGLCFFRCHCCENGYLATLWMLLCRFDLLFPPSSVSADAKLASSPGKSLAPSNGKLIRPAGTGYGDHYRSDSSGSSHEYGSVGSGTGPYKHYSKWSSTTMPPTRAIAKTTKDTGTETIENLDKVTKMLEVLVGLLVLAPQDNATSIAISSMLKLSLVFDKVAEILRNDALEYVELHDALYGKTFDLLEQIGRSPNLRYLVTEERYGKSSSPGLLLLSLGSVVDRSSKAVDLYLPVHDGKDASVLSILESIHRQSCVVLQAKTRDPKLINICQRVKEVHSLLFEQIVHVNGSVPTLDPKQQWVAFHKSTSLTFSDSILDDLLPVIKTDADNIADGLQYARTTHARNNRILTECAIMRTSLDDGTFVIVSESRPDCMRVLMLGPQDTAYADGLFE